MPPPNFEQYCHARARELGVDFDQLDLEKEAADFGSLYGLKTAVFVDDERQPKHRLDGFQNWVWCRTAQEWQDYLMKMGPPDFVSFDHDLSPEHYQDAVKFEHRDIQAIEYGSFKTPTGFDCAVLYADFCELNGLEMKAVAAHCVERPMGAYNIKHALDGYLESKGSDIRCYIAEVPTLTLTEKARASGLIVPGR